MTLKLLSYLLPNLGNELTKNGFLEKKNYFKKSAKRYASDLTLIGMKKGGLTPLLIFGLDFVSKFSSKNFKHFWG